MKILSIDDMLEVAHTEGLASYDAHREAIETAATALAQDIADHFQIQGGPATWEGKEFGGTCATFRPGKRKDCPPEIADGDPAGDWE